MGSSERRAVYQNTKNSHKMRNKISNGTKHSITLANDANKPVYIYWPEPEKLMKGIGI